MCIFNAFPLPIHPYNNLPYVITDRTHRQVGAKSHSGISNFPLNFDTVGREAGRATRNVIRIRSSRQIIYGGCKRNSPRIVHPQLGDTDSFFTHIAKRIMIDRDYGSLKQRQGDDKKQKSGYKDFD
jgi:hypothetical protein